MMGFKTKIRTLVRITGGAGVREIFRIVAEELRAYYTEDNFPTFEAMLREDLDQVIKEVKAFDGL